MVGRSAGGTRDRHHGLAPPAGSCSLDKEMENCARSWALSASRAAQADDQRRPAERTRRSDAEQFRHSTPSGIARSRPGEIGAPQASQTPYVPSSSFASARSVRVNARSSVSPTGTSVKRLTASDVPSPMRFPKLTVLPRSGRAASTPKRWRSRSRRASSSARTASRSRSPDPTTITVPPTVRNQP